MILKEPLQPVIDGFVRKIGGQVIRDLIGNNNPSLNADYQFGQHGVIAELKALEDDRFGRSLRTKIARTMAEWQKQGKLRVYGRVRIETRRLPVECQNELADLLAKPIQRLVHRANRQIEVTKSLPAVQLPMAKGLLWVASDGNEDFQPETVWFLLKRILQKKHEDGSPQYSNIHAVAYFNPRSLVALPSSEDPTLFWLSGSRNPDDEGMIAFLNFLCESWYQHLEAANGIKIRRTAEPQSLEGLRFLGSYPPMPLIDMREHLK